jgi:ATP-dependent helicase/nuclease subunit A
MGEANWTEEQKKAIFTKDCNLLVAAGAGAGKTAVLVERIIQRITDVNNNYDIDSMLIVTFTNAAASEMRERIGNALSREIDKKPDSKKLHRQLTLLSKANIMTIHSFCLLVIRNHFHILDIDPDFRICEETEGLLLRVEALEEVFEERYESADKGFLNLVDAYGGKDDTPLQDIVLGLHRFAESAPWPKKWLLSSAEKFNVKEDFDFASTTWADVLLSDIKIELEGFKSMLLNAIAEINQFQELDYYIPTYKCAKDDITNIIETDDFEALSSKISAFSFEKLPTKKLKDPYVVLIRDKVKKVKDTVKKGMDKLQVEIQFDMGEIREQLKKMYPLMKSLSQLVIDFDNRFAQKKREKGIVDFNDIEHFCLDILTIKDEQDNIIPSEVALNYRKKFEEVLVDEYQDSNMIQEIMMNMISRSGEKQNITKIDNKIDVPNRFMVGDIKQSIYRFRQAMPEIFLGKYNTYSQEEGAFQRKLKLFKNFRSRKEVIDAVNYIFKQIMSENIGEINYNQTEELKVGANYDNPFSHFVEVNILEKKSFNKTEEIEIEDSEMEEGKDSEEEVVDDIQLEARLAAHKIKELMADFKVFDSSLEGYRKLKYRDIVILMRTTANWATIFMDEFKAEGIPVFADAGSGYFETIEIKTMLSLLQLIDNPLQDIPCISVLRSPIASFKPEELVDIRLVDRQVPFYVAMKIIHEGFDTEKIKHVGSELKIKVDNFMKHVNVWREKTLHMSIDEFIWYLYTDTGYFGFCGAMPGGTQRQANLRILFERAREFEKTSYKGLFNFVNFINRLRYSSGDMGSAKTLGENEDVVRIMSIHKSKGLEFPVVMLCGTGKNFNMMDLSRTILFHQELGFGPDFVDTERRITYPTILKQVLKKKIKFETLSEEMRILYVAMTRAKEKLVITGMVKSTAEACSKWSRLSQSSDEKIQQYSVLSSKNFLDWICTALIRHTDGQLLREISGDDFNGFMPALDSSKWEIKTWKREDFTINISKVDNETDLIKEIESQKSIVDVTSFANDVKHRLEWSYGYSAACFISAKFSVSELKRIQYNEENEGQELIESFSLKKPSFIESVKKLSSTEKGTIMHFVMQHLNLDSVASVGEIDKQIKQLVSRDFLTEEQSEVVDRSKILKFFNSSLGKRMLSSNHINREVPFYVEIDSSKIYPELDNETYSSEKVLVQGIIDCYFEEGDSIVLLDYKTDFALNVQEIKKKYAVQIKLYADALKRITGKMLKNCYLYLFYNGQTVEIEV